MAKRKTKKRSGAKGGSKTKMSKMGKDMQKFRAEYQKNHPHASFQTAMKHAGAKVRELSRKGKYD